jgi:hypothetical protein
MREVRKLIRARQAQYGIETDSPTGWVTLRDAGFGNLVLSVEVGDPGDVATTISSHATEADQYDLLCRLEGIDWSWEQEQERYRLLDLHEDDEDGDYPFIADYDRQTPPDNAR